MSDITKAGCRVVTTAAELNALPPESVVLEDDPNLDGIRPVLQKRSDGAWNGAYYTATAEKVVDRPDWKGVVLHTGTETRSGAEIAEALAPMLIDTLKRHIAERYPNVSATIRRSKKARKYKEDGTETYVNVQWADPAANPRREFEVGLELDNLARGIGYPTGYLNVRWKKTRPPGWVSARTIEKHVQEVDGYRTRSDAYLRAKGVAGVMVRQNATGSVTIAVETTAVRSAADIDDRNGDTAVAAGIAKSLTEAGYLVETDERATWRLTVSKPIATEQES